MAEQRIVGAEGSQVRLPPKFGYNAGLDGLRAISVLGVIAGHGLYPVPGGYHGVTVFFVISGYLITSLLMAEYAKSGAIRFRHFYWRRFARLGPALILVALVTSAFLVATRVPIASWWGGAVGSLTYSTDLIAAFLNNTAVSNYFQYTWSLGIEEQFYLFWPLLLLLLLRRGKLAWSLSIIALGIVATWGVRLWESIHGVSRPAAMYGPFTHTDALLLGCALAIVVARFPSSRALRRFFMIVGPVGAAVMLGIFLYGGIPFFYDQFGPTALASAAMVGWVAVSPRSWFGWLMALPPLAFIGRLSYSLYLWNILLLWSFVDVTGVRPAQTHWGVLWIVASIGVAYLSYRFVETPLRKKWAPPQAHAVMQTPGALPIASEARAAQSPG